MDGNFSDWDRESESADEKSYSDYVPGSSEYGDDSVFDENVVPPNSDEIISSNPDDTANQNPNQLSKWTEIDYASDLSLAPIVKAKSNADVELWKRFGSIMRAGKTVKGLADRPYCCLCFEKQVMKRLVFC